MINSTVYIVFLSKDSLSKLEKCVFVSHDSVKHLLGGKKKKILASS